MNRNLALRRTLDAIAHLDDPQPPWRDLLQGMQQVIGGDSATFILLERGSELLSFQQVNVSPAAEREYVQHFCAHDILIPPTLGAAPGSWFDTHELFSPAFLSKNLYYADFMCRHGARQMLACIVDQGAQQEIVERYIRALGIKCTSPDQKIRELSGGNQQKVLLARWLCMNPRLLIVDEPTRGIDVGAKAEILKLIRGLSEEGLSVLMISSELEELVAAADHVTVLSDGRSVADFTADELSEDRLMGAMAHQN